MLYDLTGSIGNTKPSWLNAPPLPIPLISFFSYPFVIPCAGFISNLSWWIKRLTLQFIWAQCSALSSLFQKVAFWRPLTVKWSPSPDFRQNFGRQKFFPLAMVTKMVAAWSAGLSHSLPLNLYYFREQNLWWPWLTCEDQMIAVLQNKQLELTSYWVVMIMTIFLRR